MKRVSAILVLLAASAAAQSLYRGGRGITDSSPMPAAPPPDVLHNVSIEQKLDAQLPLDLAFKDEAGRDVRLGSYFGSKPVVLSLVYYDCPMLCGEVLNGMTSAFRALSFDAGREFNVVNVSFDPRETPQLAAGKKKSVLKVYQRPTAEQGWHFLTGPPASINALTRAVGFNYQWDERTQQYAHAAAIMVVTPDGRISRYFYGVEYAPKDLRFGLIEASQRKIGGMVDAVLLYCYHYDPRTGKYGAIISRVLKLAGAATVVILGGFIVLMLRLEPRYRRRAKGGHA